MFYSVIIEYTPLTYSSSRTKVFLEDFVKFSKPSYLLIVQNFYETCGQVGLDETFTLHDFGQIFLVSTFS